MIALKIVLIFTLFLLQFTQCANLTENDVCNNRGIYDTTARDCQCIAGVITYPSDSFIKCNYELRSQRIAQFLSFFGGVLGADLFYLGFTYKAMMKCMCPIILLFLLIFIQSYYKHYQIPDYYFLVPVMIIFLFWMIDNIRICFGWIKDYNGNSLYSGD